MLFMSNTSTPPRPAFAMASRVRFKRYSCRRRKSTRSSQSTFIRPGAGSDATGNSALGMLARSGCVFGLLIGGTRLRAVLEPIRHLAILGQQVEVRARGFELEKAREVNVTQLVADQVHHDLMHQRRHWHRDVELARGLQPELEILAQQLAGERRREIEIDECRGLVTRESRTHDAAVEKLEVVSAGHAAAFGEHCGLGHDLCDHPEHEVVTDLDEARAFAFADVGDSGPEQLEVGERGLESLAW